MNAQAERPDREAGQAGAQPDEAQLRAAYEAELSRITSVDMVLQAAASLLNIGAHRLGLTGGDPAASAAADRRGDLEQVRDAIDAVRGLLPVIERSAAAELRPLRDALSQLQMAYTRAVQAQAPTAPAQGQGSPGESATSAPSGQAPDGQAGGAGGTAGSGGPTQGGQTGGVTPQNDPSRPGPAETSGRLWVPGR
ncbi:MAG TPA: hypothetical protein VGI76_03380 [Solirubrobacteraceae bacterium]|jgi:hypothetical protein